MKIEDIRKVQEQSKGRYIAKKIDVSIDRLTVLLRHEEIFLMREFDNLYFSFSQAQYSQDLVFKRIGHSIIISVMLDTVHEVNLLYLEYIVLGTDEVIRIDFNPHSLKEYKGMEIWEKIFLYIQLSNYQVSLSRIDIAFDLFNYPEVVALKNMKGGVSKRLYFGRAEELETAYWGASGSDVQVRLYDKNKERLQKGKLTMTDLEDNLYWWRLEFQMRTKVIDSELVDELKKRLEQFRLLDIIYLPVNMRPFAYVYLIAPESLEIVFPDLTREALKKRKKRLREKLAEIEKSNDFSNQLIEALTEQSAKLAKELKQYTQEFLGFE